MPARGGASGTLTKVPHSLIIPIGHRGYPHLTNLAHKYLCFNIFRTDTVLLRTPSPYPNDGIGVLGPFRIRGTAVEPGEPRAARRQISRFQFAL